MFEVQESYRRGNIAPMEMLEMENKKGMLQVSIIGGRMWNSFNNKHLLLK